MVQTKSQFWWWIWIKMQITPLIIIPNSHLIVKVRLVRFCYSKRRLSKEYGTIGTSKKFYSMWNTCSPSNSIRVWRRHFHSLWTLRSASVSLSMIRHSLRVRCFRCSASLLSLCTHVPPLPRKRNPWAASPDMSGTIRGGPRLPIQHPGTVSFNQARISNP